MKGLLRRALSRLRNDKRGETLFESVVSILVFTILLVTVSLIVLVSFSVTGSANARATAMNGEARATMTGDTEATPSSIPPTERKILLPPTESTIEFHFENGDTHPVKVMVYESDELGFNSFEYKWE